MFTYQIHIEYLGTQFVGWQIQSKGKSVQKLIQTNVKSLFKVMAYENDFEIIEGKKIWRDAYYELDESNMSIYGDLKNNKKNWLIP